MNKEQQDQLWNDLSEEKKEKYSKEYKEAIDDCGESAIIERRILLAEIFGTHNLNSEPQIKTWEDYERIKGKINVWVNVTGYIPEDKIDKKAVATLKIAKLIELGYGGMVSEEEYDTKVFWNIVANRQNKKTKLNIVSNYDAIGNVLTFRSYELAYEFMSYESNCRLVEVYYLM